MKSFDLESIPQGEMKFLLKRLRSACYEVPGHRVGLCGDVISVMSRS